MNKKLSKIYRVGGVVLILLAVVVLAVRSQAIDVFADVKHKSFLPPAGQMLAKDTEEFSFAVASDTGGKNEPIERIIKDVRKNTDAKFVLHLGDLVRYRNPSHFDWIADEVAVKLKDLPFYMIPGNHEIEAEDGVIEKHLYTEKFGQPYYWFGYGNTLFIGLDSSEEKIDNEQFKWLETVLTRVRPGYENCVIFTHVPPISPKGENKKKLDEVSKNKLAEVLKGKSVSLILAGHVHYFSKSKFEGVSLITALVSGQEFRDATKEFGYLLVKIDGKNIEVKDRYVKTEGETDYFEIFMSSAMVKKEVKYGAIGMAVLGLLLIVVGRRRRVD